MIIAKIGGDGSITVGNYKELFQYTSFPLNGPSQEWLVENNCMPVSRSIDHDPATEKLVNSLPYVLDGVVYIVQKVLKTPEEIEAERKASIPTSVTMRQGRLAMLMTPYAGGTLLDVIEAMLDSIPDMAQKRAARIDWEYAQTIDRSFPLVYQLTAQLGMTERQIDDLFALASTL